MSITPLVKEAKQAYQDGNVSVAQRKLRQAIQIDPQHPKLWLTLVKLSKTPDEAVNVLKQAQEFHPNHPKIQSALESKQHKVRSQAITNERRLTRPFIYGALGLVALFACLLMSFIWFRGQQPVAASSENLEIVDNSESQVVAQPVSLPELPAATPTQRPLLSKQVIAQDEPRATWTVTPTPSPTPTPTPSVIPTFVSSSAYTQKIRPFGVSNNERWIDVDLSTQVLKAYEGDFLVFSTPISSGTSEHRTVTGQFRIWLKFESQTMDGRRLGYDYYLENVPYVMYFFEDYAIHGAYWHNNFGTPMSHGCVNVEPADAGWLFNWASYGTLVNVHY